MSSYQGSARSWLVMISELAFLEDLQQITQSLGQQRFRLPIVEPIASLRQRPERGNHGQQSPGVWRDRRHIPS